MAHHTRPAKITTDKERIEELEYLVMRICQSLKIPTRY